MGQLRHKARHTLAGLHERGSPALRQGDWLARLLPAHPAPILTRRRGILSESAARRRDTGRANATRGLSGRIVGRAGAGLACARSWLRADLKKFLKQTRWGRPVMLLSWILFPVHSRGRFGWPRGPAADDKAEAGAHQHCSRQGEQKSIFGRYQDGEGAGCWSR